VWAVALLRLFGLFDSRSISNFAGWFLKTVSPLLPRNRIGRDNLSAAYPDKSLAEISRLLRTVWINMGRVYAEYAHLDTLWDYDETRQRKGRIEISEETAQRVAMLRNDGKPALLFTAHLGNWELCAVGLASLDIDTLILYRRPSIRRIDEAIRKLRSGSMGALVPASQDAVFTIIKALSRGAHVGMVVDQHFGRGVDITFFGRTCKANPTLARLAQRFECPIHGVRIVRLPGYRFRFEVTPELEPVRGADGKIDVQATTQKINGVIEGWVREHPDQWLWLHRRWR
jgi:KDO2-lipid IV(A) lauroyltransferase